MLENTTSVGIPMERTVSGATQQQSMSDGSVVMFLSAKIQTPNRNLNPKLNLSFQLQRQQLVSHYFAIPIHFNIIFHYLYFDNNLPFFCCFLQIVQWYVFLLFRPNLCQYCRRFLPWSLHQHLRTCMWHRWKNLQQRLFSSDGKINSLISICYCRISILFANFFDWIYLDILFNIQAACTSTNSITKAYDGECAAGNFHIQRIQKLLFPFLCSSVHQRLLLFLLSSK